MFIYCVLLLSTVIMYCYCLLLLSTVFASCFVTHYSFIDDFHLQISVLDETISIIHSIHECITNTRLVHLPTATD